MPPRAAARARVTRSSSRTNAHGAEAAGSTRTRSSARSSTRSGGGRATARSSPRANRRGTATRGVATASHSQSEGPSPIAALQQRLQELTEKFEQKEDEHRGVVDQMQAQIDDLSISNLGGAAGGSAGEVELLGTQGPPLDAATPATPPAAVQKMALKEAMTEWKNLHTRMAWLVLGRRPLMSTLTASQWQASYPDVHISSQIASTLNTFTRWKTQTREGTKV